MYLSSLSHLSSIKNPNLTFTGLIHILNKFDRISCLELKHIDLPYDPFEEYQVVGTSEFSSVASCLRLSRGHLGVSPEHEDHYELTPLGSLGIFNHGLNISPEDALWFEGKVGYFLGHGESSLCVCWIHSY